MAANEAEEEDAVGGTTVTFTALVRKAIQINQYPSDPLITNIPELKSTQSQSRPSIFRLPPSKYVLDKLNCHRQELLNTTRKSPDRKLFFKPPSSLERVAEVGDPLHCVNLKLGF